MKKLGAILFMAVITAGCVDGKFIKRTTENKCEGTGWTHTFIHYGDSRVIVIPLSDAVSGEEMRFYLVPQIKGRAAKDYQNATIKISAKPAADPWFADVQGQASQVFLSTCVKDGLAVGSEHEYKVEVIMPGETPPLKALLDPRAIIITK
ncbi:MAG: hypothetical protein GTO71_06590 [Woeseiaceae bacterium]|nr:hypothetical protein [Woeseiaceae bacterium]NIP20764.1 hypothetical protein [Woeseiaceae bacterium]NIS89557.1 hypothetical protein [Woeseiaceae bacterium]